MLWKGFQRPKRLECDLESLTPTYGKFYAQPFERGFGTTIGNALRRGLLFSRVGGAVTPGESVRGADPGISVTRARGGNPTLHTQAHKRSPHRRCEQPR